MSDRIAHSYSDYNGIAGQSVHSYQSVWMARWTQTTCNVPPRMHSSSHPCTIDELTAVETSDIYRPSKGFKEVEAKSFGVVNDSLALSFRNLRNRKLTEYHIQNPLEQANSDIPLEDDIIGSSSHTVPRKFERKSSNMRILEQEHRKYHGDSVLHHEDSMIQKTSQSVRDRTLRIRSSMNSYLEGFSQGSRGFLITEDTNVDLCEENQLLGKSRALTRFGGKTSSESNNFFPLFGSRKRGVKLQPLGPLHISTDSEEEDENEEKEENFRKLKAFGVPTDESSAETDTMDIDSLKENPFYGVKSAAPNKAISVDLKIPELLDINIKLPALPGGAISLDNPEPSTSRTQSLDMELMHPPCNERNNSKFDPTESEPSDRWIKRLKLNKMGFIGTASSNLDETLTHKKENKFFEIMKGSISSTTTTSEVKDEDISLSNPWIVRWRPRQHDTPPAQQQKADPVVVCDPQNLNLDDFQKKQFPSTAAMALMGKSLSGFQTCEVRKRGSFVVWNSKSFE